MVDDLLSGFGRHGTIALLGIPWMTVRNWRERHFAPNFAARRAIWLVWCLTLHPERLRCLGDLVTWGKLPAEDQSDDRPAREWSNWEI
jgi:hypothetical protein